MNKEELEQAVIKLEEEITSNKSYLDECATNLIDVRKQLADINKPELTSSQLDDIYEAVETGVGNFDFSDTDNFEIEYGISYDGKVECESHEFRNSQDLVEMIAEQVSKLFTEADCPEELDTTEDDNHPVEKLQN